MITLLDLSAVNDFSATGFRYLLDVSLKAAVILLFTLCLKLFIGSASAAARHFVLCITFFCLLSIPFVSLILPAWDIYLRPSNSLNALEIRVIQQAGIVKENGDDSANILTNETIAGSENAKTIFQISSFSFSRCFWIFLIYLMGAGWVIGRQLIGIEKIWRIKRQSILIKDSCWAALEKSLTEKIGIGRHVKIYRSFNIPLPVTFGFWRSSVLLPVTCSAWDESRRQTVLLHEFAHIKRRDCAVQLLTQIICALYWFNPLVWLMARKLRLEAEHACDNVVLAHQVKASVYAEELLSFARAQSLFKSYRAAAVAIVRRTHLEKRLRLILEPQTARCPLGINGKIFVCLAFTALLLPVSAARFLNSEKESTTIGIVMPETSERSNQLPQVIEPIFNLSSNAQILDGQTSRLNLKKQREPERQKTNSPLVSGLPSKSDKKNLDKSADLPGGLNRSTVYHANNYQNPKLSADIDNSGQEEAKQNPAKKSPSSPQAEKPDKNLPNMAGIAGFMARQATFMAGQARFMTSLIQKKPKKDKE